MEATAQAPHLGAVLHVNFTQWPIIGHGINNFVRSTPEGSLEDVITASILKDIIILNNIIGDVNSLPINNLRPLLQSSVVQNLAENIEALEVISGRTQHEYSAIKILAYDILEIYPEKSPTIDDRINVINATQDLGVALRETVEQHGSIEDTAGDLVSPAISYLDEININTDTTWMDFLTPAELTKLQVVDAANLKVPSDGTYAELRMVAEARIAEQTANLDKTTGTTNYVDPVGDGVLNLPEGWEKVGYAMVQAVMTGQGDSDASAQADKIDKLTQAYNSGMVSAGNSAYGIYNAALSGDGLALAQNTVNLVTSIDQAVDSYLKLEGVGDGGFLSKEMGQELGKVGAGLNFAGDLIELTESIGSGDADETHEIIDYRLAA